MCVCVCVCRCVCVGVCVGVCVCVCVSVSGPENMCDAVLTFYNKMVTMILTQFKENAENDIFFRV